MPPGTTHRGRSILAKLLFALLAAGILAGAGGTGALLAYQNRFADRIYDGVVVDGVALGGYDRPGARIALERGLARYGAGTVTIAADGRSISMPFTAANRHADIDRLLDQAFGVGRTGDGLALAAGGIRTRLDGALLEPAVLLDRAALANAVDAVAATVDLLPVDATITVTPSGFATTAATPGRELDRAGLVDAIATRIADAAAAQAVSVTANVASITPHTTDEEAAAAVRAAAAMAQDVVLVSGEETLTIPSATVRSWISFLRDANGAWMPVLADDAPATAVAALAPDVARSPIEANFIVRPNGKVGVSPGRDGRTLDVQATTRAVVAAVRARASGGALPIPPTVAVTAVVTRPTLSTEDAEKAVKKIRKISQWTTYYQPSDHNGFGNNITIPAREINGTVVAPGATFSWWAALQPVNDASLLRRGYRYGGAIVNGHSEEGKAIAGGICSSSTTLFNAVARAGYKIKSRYNHYYFIDRYPTGFDATVVYGSKDLRWTNDSPYPVIIRGSGRPGAVTFALWTVPVNDRKAVIGGSRIPGRPNATYRVANGRTVTIRSTGLGGYTPPGSPITRTTTNPREHGTVIDYPVPGFNITVTRRVVQEGKAILEDSWYSRYTMMRLLTLVYKKPT